MGGRQCKTNKNNFKAFVLNTVISEKHWYVHVHTYMYMYMYVHVKSINFTKIYSSEQRKM